MSDRPVFIALGSNLSSSVGDRLATLVAALERLDATPGLAVSQASSAWETEAIGPPQPRYLNAAAELRTSLTTRQVLDRSLDVERSLGRDRTSEERWGARPIDIDLIFDGESVIDEPGLAVPHPSVAERAFVLAPLAEIAPDLCDPRSGRTVRSLLAQLSTDRVSRYGSIPFCTRLTPGNHP